jgi:hypothetical protein
MNLIERLKDPDLFVDAIDEAIAEIERLQTESEQIRRKLAEHFGGLPDDDAEMGVDQLIVQVRKLEKEG